MIVSRPVMARRAGTARILSLVVLAGCIAESPTSSVPQIPSFAPGSGGGPSVRSTDPDTGLRNTTLDVRVLGSGFDNGSKAVWALAGDTAFATTKVTVNSTRFVKTGELVANITIAADAPLAFFDVVVITLAGKKGIGIEKFAVKENGQTPYGMTFQGGLESDASHPYSTFAKTGDPFASPVSGNPVYLMISAAAGGVTAVCDADGSGLGATSASWGGYSGIWKGSFSVSVKSGKYHLSFVATRDTGGGYLNLVVNGPAAKSNGNLTLTFTNARGLVAANSTPNGGPKDPQDRCLTFSITATP